MFEVRTCVDRVPMPRNANERLALLANELWGAGYSLRIAFLDGEPTLQERVKKAALEWTTHAPVTFAFVNDPNTADIRIAFSRRGSWSMIGKQANGLSKSDPTMNFGWLTLNSTDGDVSSVVLHEFGHALGCIHEHQHPAGGIPWNKQAVYDFYAGYPNYWTKEKVDTNIFNTYAANLTVHTAKPDPLSIMMYPIDKRLTDGNYEVGLNTALSAGDIAFIKQAYQ